jgi:hypothetical protein
MRAAFVVAIMGLLFAEFLRVIRLPVSGVAVHRYMSQYIGTLMKKCSCGKLHIKFLKVWLLHPSRRSR